MNTSTRPVIFTDLDDTIFVNQRKLPVDFAEGYVTAVADTDDRISVMTAKQQSFYRWIVQTAEVVPITARSYEGFNRISLDFGDGWKIAGNGSVVVAPGGRIDEEWKNRISADLADYQDDMQKTLEWASSLAAQYGIDVKVKRYREHGYEHCVLLSHDGDRAHMLGLVAKRMRLSDERFHVHLNGGTLAFTAKPVSKKRAAGYVLSKIQDAEGRVVLGFGDSLSDLGFMSVCDFMGIPSGSQISETLVAA